MLLLSINQMRLRTVWTQSGYPRNGASMVHLVMKHANVPTTLMGMAIPVQSANICACVQLSMSTSPLLNIKGLTCQRIDTTSIP